MKHVGVIKVVVGLGLLASAAYGVGTWFGWLLLRTFDWRPLNTSPDWLDSVVGITVIMIPALLLLLVRLRIARSRPLIHAAPE